MTEVRITSTRYEGMDSNGWYETLTEKGYTILVDHVGEDDPAYLLVIPENATWDYLLKLRHDIDHEVILTDDLEGNPVIEIYDDWRE